MFLEDFILREKITHFDHERIPERIVHARGTGVHGHFELTHSLKEYTTAKILTEVGEKTPLFTRILSCKSIRVRSKPGLAIQKPRISKALSHID